MPLHFKELTHEITHQV